MRTSELPPHPALTRDLYTTDNLVGTTLQTSKYQGLHKNYSVIELSTSDKLNLEILFSISCNKTVQQ